MYNISVNNRTFFLEDKDVEEFLFVHFPTTNLVVDGQEMTCSDFKIKFFDDEYKRKRAISYPSIVDQLDLLYHTGYEGWKEAISQIKLEYPKPEGVADGSANWHNN